MCFAMHVREDRLRPGIAPLNLLGRYVALLSLGKPGTGVETPEVSWGIVEPMVRFVRRSCRRPTLGRGDRIF